MHHLAATFRMILGDIDLTVTDRHVALVLAGCLQLLRRRRRVARCLLPKDQWPEVCLALQAAHRAQEADRRPQQKCFVCLLPIHYASISLKENEQALLSSRRTCWQAAGQCTNGMRGI